MRSVKVTLVDEKVVKVTTKNMDVPFGERQRQTRRQNMNIFDDVKLGLEQAIEYEQRKNGSDGAGFDR